MPLNDRICSSSHNEAVMRTRAGDAENRDHTVMSRRRHQHFTIN
jgi:hypothetical protein